MRQFNLYIYLILLGIILIPLEASAKGIVWQAQEIEGKVEISAQGKKGPWRVINADALITSPFTVRTGKKGQVVMNNGTDIVRVSNNSELFIEEQQESSFFTRIIQRIGVALFKIKKTPEREFEVVTPFLVSVVKGTTFHIEVTDDRAVASLHEGSLEVRKRNSKESTLIKPGEVAMAVASEKKLIIISPATSDEVPASGSGNQSIAVPGASVAQQGQVDLSGLNSQIQNSVNSTISESNESVGSTASSVVGTVNSVTEEAQNSVVNIINNNPDALGGINLNNINLNGLNINNGNNGNNGNSGNSGKKK